jgi:hypothetical protein
MHFINLMFRRCHVNGSAPHMERLDRSMGSLKESIDQEMAALGRTTEAREKEIAASEGIRGMVGEMIKRLDQR